MKLVVLYGPPAVGKLSVAQALAARTGFRVLHNHLLIDLRRALFDDKTPLSRAFTRDLRDLSLEAARMGGLSGVIVTFVYAKDHDAYILNLCERAEAAEDEVCLVHLTCALKTLEARVSEPSRHTFDKLTTAGGLRRKLATLEAPFGAVRGRESLNLHTDQLTPESVAEAVVRHLRSSERGRSDKIERPNRWVGALLC